MDVLTGMIEHDLWLIGQMLERAATLPEEVLDGPVAPGLDDSSLREVLTQLVWQKERWSSAIEGVEAPDGEPAPVPELQQRLSEVTPRFTGLASRALSEGRADETFIDATCDPPHTFTFGGMIAHVLTFSAYRRTIVLEALERSAGSEEHRVQRPSGLWMADGILYRESIRFQHQVHGQECEGCCDRQRHRRHQSRFGGQRDIRQEFRSGRCKYFR